MDPKTGNLPGCVSMVASFAFHGSKATAHDKVLRLAKRSTFVSPPVPRGRSNSSCCEWDTMKVAALDLFVVPTVDLRMLFALVIVAIDRRLIVTINVTPHPTAEWIAQQLTEAFPWESAPKYLIRDRDDAFGAAFKRRLHTMGIRDRPSAPQSPWQNGYAERLIGSIRRECLDHLIALGEAHLRRILRRYVAYYSDFRTHLSLTKDAPSRRRIQHHRPIIRLPVLGGLHHEYVRG